MRYAILIAGMLGLSGCTVPQTVANEAVDERNNAHYTIDDIAKWVLTPPGNETPQPVPPTYCYRVYQDILCYRQAMVGWEDRLIAYQGTHASPPPPAFTQPMPMREGDTSMLPANRIANAKPVFVSIPPDTKAAEAQQQDQDGKTAVPTAPDAAHETLPDPALAPQL